MSLSQDDILTILRNTVKNLWVPIYRCVNDTNVPPVLCCRSSVPFTRLDEYCKTLPLDRCVVPGRPCRIDNCSPNLNYTYQDTCYCSQTKNVN